MPFRVTRSGAAFSPWEVSRAITGSLPNFSFGELLMRAFRSERDNEAEGTEGKDLDGVTFEPIAIITPPSSKPSTPTTSEACSPPPPPPQLPGTHSHTNAPAGLSIPHPDSTGHAADNVAITTSRPLAVRKKPSPSQIIHQKLRSKKRRAASRRDPDKVAQKVQGPVKPAIHQRHIAQASPIVAHGFSLADKTPARTGYVGLRDHQAKKRCYKLDELVGENSREGFSLVEWDGQAGCPLIDKDGRVIGALCGRPADPSWDKTIDEATKLMRDAQPRIRRTKKNSNHRRGRFTALATGVSFGGGQRVPGNLRNSAAHTAILSAILTSVAFIRLAGFANGCFATWAPRLFKYYVAHINLLFSTYGHLLTRTFANTVFAASTFNFGPLTISFPHTDPGNLPFGFCGITSLGNFDPRLGGHLVLWDLRLVIEFPPGSTILIPSAVLCHSNIAIRAGETRYSFTQYTAGGLFRWVDHGFQKEPEYFGGLTEEELEKENEAMEQRWSMGLGLFSTIDELQAAHI